MLHLRRRSRAKFRSRLRPLELRRPDREADEDDHPAGAGQRHERQPADHDQQRRRRPPRCGRSGAMRGWRGSCAARPSRRPRPRGSRAGRARRWCRSWPESPTGAQPHGSMRSPALRAKTSAARAVTGPGAGSDRSSTAEIGSTSLVELVRNTSSAVVEHRQRQRLLAHGHPLGAAPLERQLAGDAGQAARVQRRREHAPRPPRRTRWSRCPRTARRGCWRRPPRCRRAPWRRRARRRSRRTTSSSARRSRCARCGSTGPRRPSRAPAAAAGRPAVTM